MLDILPGLTCRHSSDAIELLSMAATENELTDIANIFSDTITAECVSSDQQSAVVHQVSINIRVARAMS